MWPYLARTRNGLVNKVRSKSSHILPYIEQFDQLNVTKLPAGACPAFKSVSSVDDIVKYSANFAYFRNIWQRDERGFSKKQVPCVVRHQMRVLTNP